MPFGGPSSRPPPFSASTAFAIDANAAAGRCFSRTSRLLFRPSRSSTHCSFSADIRLLMRPLGMCAASRSHVRIASAAARAAGSTGSGSITGWTGSDTTRVGGGDGATRPPPPFSSSISSSSSSSSLSSSSSSSSSSSLSMLAFSAFASSAAVFVYFAVVGGLRR